MTVTCGSYSRRMSAAHKSALQGLAAVVALSVISGCSLSSGSGPEVVSIDHAITSSVVAQSKPKGVAGTDAEVIKTTVASASNTQTVVPLAWQNPETGSSGTIMAIDKFMGKHGQSCRGFKTSVATFMGIALYNGEACQISPDEWVLSWFKPSE